MSPNLPSLPALLAATRGVRARSTVEPGAASIVPGKATLTLQFRDPSAEQQALFHDTARELIDAAAAAVGSHRVRVEPRWRGGGAAFQGLAPALMQRCLTA